MKYKITCFSQPELIDSPEYTKSHEYEIESDDKRIIRVTADVYEIDNGFMSFWNDDVTEPAAMAELVIMINTDIVESMEIEK